MATRTGHLTDFGNDCRQLAYLITGTAEKRQAFCFEMWPEVWDTRGKTSRIHVFLLPDDTVEEIDAKMTDAAKKCDVTLQRMCYVGPPKDEDRQTFDLGDGATASVGYCQEEYPVLHLAKNGRQYPPAK